MKSTLLLESGLGLKTEWIFFIIESHLNDKG